MKGEILMKLLAGLICIFAPVVVGAYAQNSSEESPIQPSVKIAVALSVPADRQPQVSAEKIAWFVGEWTLVIVGTFVGFILLLKILGASYELFSKGSLSKLRLGLGLAVLGGLLAAIYFLPRSQALIFNSWQTISDLSIYLHGELACFEFTIGFEF